MAVALTDGLSATGESEAGVIDRTFSYPWELCPTLSGLQCLFVADRIDTSILLFIVCAALSI